ncbi:MAG: universal stress protein [Saprospiraceae bacterium]|nr:universal stress protein [Saprospiraceae bacterium]
MKKILIPTDFSETARDAYIYALDFCKNLGTPCSLKVVHVFMPEAASTPTFIPPVQEFMELKEKTLKEFANNITEKPANVEAIETEQLIGFPGDEVIELSKNFDLIIMGTTGDGGFLEKLFGSVSTIVAQRAHCAVLLVPNGTKFEAPTQMLYSSSAEASDERLIEQLVMFNKPYQARIHFVHVEREGDEAFSKSKEEIFEELFEDGEPPFAFEFANIKNADIDAAINQYAEAESIDMIVMATRQRSFWEQLFHKSQTKLVALHARLPLLILHPGD